MPSWSSKWLRHDLTIVSSSTALAHGIGICAAPILSRIYGARQFGSFQIYTSVLSFLMAIASCRYETAIFLPERDDEAGDVIGASILATFVVAGIAAISGYLCFRDGEIRASTWLLIFLAVVAAGTYQSFMNWTIRKRQFLDLAAARIGQAVVLVGVQLSSGIAAVGFPGLMVGDAVSRVSGAVLMTWRILRTCPLSARQLSGIRAAAYRYRSFPLITMPSTLLNSAISLIPLLLGHLYGTEVIGLYALVDRVLNAPTAFMGQSITQVYMSRLSGMMHADRASLCRLYRATVGRLALVGLVPTIVVAALGPKMFAMVFGRGWHEAGMYARIMAFSALLSLTASPVTATLALLNAQIWQFCWDAGRLAAVVGAVCVSFKLGASARGTLMAYAATMVLCYVVQLSLGWLVVRRTAQAVATTDMRMSQAALEAS